MCHKFQLKIVLSSSTENCFERVSFQFSPKGRSQTSQTLKKFCVVRRREVLWSNSSKRKREVCALPGRELSHMLILANDDRQRIQGLADVRMEIFKLSWKK